jgi:ribosomal protein S18 acetylase RimI-like enzyme
MATIWGMRIEPLSEAEVEALLDQFVAVYRAAFAGAPYNREEPEVAEFARALPLHTRREGFRSVAAFGGDECEVIGFAYGYRTQPGQWWHDNVCRALGDRTARVWLAEAFQVTEVAVLPAHQRQGVGSSLLDVLLHDLIYPRAVLSTLDAETAGRAMYRAQGWQDLVNGFYFPGVPRRYAIMGRLLIPEAS